MGITGIGLIAAALIFGDEGLDQIQGEGEGNGGTPVRIASTTEFDPSPGDGDETGTGDLAIDGDPETTWDSERYDTQDFGGLKDGVGLIVEVDGRPESISTVEIRSANEGWDAEIYVAEGEPPEELESWGSPVGTVSGGGTRERVELQGEPGTAYLIWITNPPEAEDGFRMQIGEVRLLS